MKEYWEIHESTAKYNNEPDCDKMNSSKDMTIIYKV